MSTIDLAGNSLATARSLTLGSSNQTITDWVGGSDTNDFYRFTLSTRSSVGMTLNSFSANADLQLIHDRNRNNIIDAGEVLVTSSATGLSADRLSGTLEVGTYFVRVFPSTGAHTGYNLTLSAQAINSAPNSLQFSLANDKLLPTGTLGVNNGLVFDANGATDIARVDFRIRRADGTFIDVADPTSLMCNGNTASFTHSLNLSALGLTAGSYSLVAQAFDRAGAASGMAERAFTILPVNAAPTALGFTLNSTSLRPTDTLNIASGTVTDTNGATDIARVDFRIRRSDGTLIDVADPTSLSRNGTTANFSHSLNLSALGLTAGNYSLVAQAFDRAGAVSNLAERTFTIQPPSDWFTQNLQDAGLQIKTRTLASDGNLSRTDMIEILRDAKDGGIIDATELTNLRSLLNTGTPFTMADHVRNLSHKVLHGDVANASYRGSSLGNLFAGSSAIQMDQLIDKWFMGGDRPKTNYGYTYAQGSLFVNGISASDVVQGAVGNCYYLATLAGIAHEKPDSIRNMFIDNGDGTFTVRFFKYGQADYVTVDRFLPTTSSGNLAYAKIGGIASNSGNELWVALAEKAYAQLNASGWIGQDGTNSYQGIEGGWMSGPIRQLTNLSNTWSDTTTMAKQGLIDLVNSNRIVTAGFTSGSLHGVVNNHAYTVTGYNASTDRFFLYNPWGKQHAELTWNQLRELQADFVYSMT